jgi:ankyrin repeat protein
MDKAFFNAARSGNADLAKELLAKKANVDYRDGERKTALCHAASQSHGAVVELLLANRADADAIDERGRSPLFFAAKFGHDEAVFMKILDAAKNLEVSNERGVTPLNIAVRTGKVHAVKALLARGADKHKGDSFGGHALASAGNSDVDEIRLAFNLSKKTTTMAPVITTQAPRVLGAAKEL